MGHSFETIKITSLADICVEPGSTVNDTTPAVAAARKYRAGENNAVVVVDLVLQDLDAVHDLGAGMRVFLNYCSPDDNTELRDALFKALHAAYIWYTVNIGQSKGVKLFVTITMSRSMFGTSLQVKARGYNGTNLQTAECDVFSADVR